MGVYWLKIPPHQLNAECVKSNNAFLPTPTGFSIHALHHNYIASEDCCDVILRPIRSEDPWAGISLWHSELAIAEKEDQALRRYPEAMCENHSTLEVMNPKQLDGTTGQQYQIGEWNPCDGRLVENLPFGLGIILRNRLRGNS
jgi:hypothetical protein